MPKILRVIARNLKQGPATDSIARQRAGSGWFSRQGEDRPRALPGLWHVLLRLCEQCHHRV